MVHFCSCLLNTKILGRNLENACKIMFLVFPGSQISFSLKMYEDYLLQTSGLDFQLFDFLRFSLCSSLVHWADEISLSIHRSRLSLFDGKETIGFHRQKICKFFI